MKQIAIAGILILIAVTIALNVIGCMDEPIKI